MVTVGSPAAFRVERAGDSRFERTASRRGRLPASSRILAVWVAAAATVAAACVAYLGVLVHMMTLGRTLASLEQQLEQERRRGELLDVALARALSPETTEGRARELWAMSRPQQVQVVVVEPSPVEAGSFRVADAGRLARPGEAGPLLAAGLHREGPRGLFDRGEAPAGIWAKARAVVQEWAARPLALARRLPDWP